MPAPQDFSESGWTGSGMMEPTLPTAPAPPPAPAPMMGEPGMERPGAKPKRATRRRKKRAPRPKAKQRRKKARPRAKKKAARRRRRR